MRTWPLCAALVLTSCREPVALDGVTNGWAAVLYFDDADNFVSATGLAPLADGISAPPGDRRVLVVWSDAELAAADAPRGLEDLARASLHVPITTDLPGTLSVGSAQVPVALDGVEPSRALRALELTGGWPKETRRSLGCCRDPSRPTAYHSECDESTPHVAVALCSGRAPRAMDVCSVDETCPIGEPRDIAELAVGPRGFQGSGVCVTDGARTRVWCEDTQLLMYPVTDHDPRWTRLAIANGFGCGFLPGGVVSCRGPSGYAEYGTVYHSVEGCGRHVCAIGPGTILELDASFKQTTDLAPGVDIAALVGDGGQTYLTQDGRVFTRSLNYGDWTGTGTGLSDEAVELPGRWRAFSVGGTWILGVAVDGAMRQWRRPYSQSESEAFVASGEPTFAEPRSFAGPWREAAAGSWMSCALDTAGRVWCWGSRASGDCGDAPRDIKEPMLIPATASGGWSELRSLGGAQVCARDAMGRWACWGDYLTRPSRFCLIQ